MRFAFAVVCCFLFGVGIGWYVGDTRSDLKKQRRLLKDYASARDLGTESELARAGSNFQENVASLYRTNELAAVVAMATLNKLEGGERQVAIDRLVIAIQRYHRMYPNERADINLIAQIEKLSKQSPSLAAAIKPKAE